MRYQPKDTLKQIRKLIASKVRIVKSSEPITFKYKGEERCINQK